MNHPQYKKNPLRSAASSGNTIPVAGKIQRPGLTARTTGGRTASLPDWRFLFFASGTQHCSPWAVVCGGPRARRACSRSVNPYIAALLRLTARRVVHPTLQEQCHA